MANNAHDANKQLDTLLSELATTQYFSAPLTYTARAELTVLLQSSSLSDLIYRQLITLNFELNEFERANLLAEQQLNKPSTALDKALLHLLTARVNLYNRNDAVAKNSINQALNIVTKLPLAQLEAQALIEQSWLLLAEQEYRQGVQVLNKAANKARIAKEPLLEVTAHLNQAFMASKAGLTELSHAQLDMANELFTLHSLATSHHVKRLNNASWVAQSQTEKLAYNQQIMEMRFSPQYAVYFYAAANTVRESYIKNGEWDLALTTLKPWQRASFQALTKAHIAFAKGDFQQGLAEAETAFVHAQIEHHKVDALDAALLLLRHHSNNHIVIKPAKYVSFIQQHATRRWRSQNSDTLARINKGNQ